MLKKIFWCFLLLPLHVVAVEVSGLYQAEIEVADQGQEARAGAISAGFEQVVIKVTGSRSAAANEAVKTLAPTAGRYVQQYRYRVKPFDDGSATPIEKTFIQMTFDRIAVNQVLSDAGLPVWGSQRPQTLAWVGIEADGKRRLLLPESDRQSDRQLVSELKQQAFNRGIAVILPLMDLEDQAALSVSDLWGSFEEPVERASQRYSPDRVAIVTLKLTAKGRVSSNWSLIGGGDNHRWEHHGQQLVNVTDAGINDIADALAVRYAPAGGSESEKVKMQVENINSFADLARVQKLLASADTVDAFDLRSAEQDKVVIAMKLRGGLQAFAQAMSISGVLMQAPPSIFDGPAAASPSVNAPAADGRQAMQAGGAPLASRQPQDADIQLFYRLP